MMTFFEKIGIQALTTRFRHGVYGEASYGFMNLKELQLIMEGALFCNPYDVVMLMKRCPMLETVFIDVSILLIS